MIRTIFFINPKDKPICLICNETVLVLKKYNYKIKHQTYDFFNGRCRVDKLTKFKNNIFSQQIIFIKSTTEQDNIFQTSFIVAEKLTKHSKLFAEGEFIKDC